MDPLQRTGGVPLGPGNYRLRAVHLGSSFDLVRASRETGGTLAPGKAHLFIPRTGVTHFLFPFGSVVSLALTSAAAEADISEFRKLVSGPSPMRVADEYQLKVDPEQKQGVEFGLVTIRQATMERLALIATILAQSNTLEHYEKVVVEMTESTAELTDQLRKGHNPPTGSRMLVFIGQALGIRRELVSQLSVLDPPESVWEDDTLDKLYHALGNNFEIPQRLRVIEHKLELIKETAEMVLSINEGRQSHRLELIVVGLIALEVILALIGHR
jgi:uncharacterized Rmd1/YagE family protein